MEKRELVQKLAVQSIVQSDYTGAFVIAPRVGKTKIVIDAIGDRIGEWSIVIATPREDINKSWVNELAKWAPGVALLEDMVMKASSLICFPSLKKVKESPDLLVVDEFHMLSINQIQMIKKIDPERLLLVSGTANEYTRAVIRHWLGIKEITFEYTIGEAIKDGIIANFHVYIVRVPLGDKYYGKVQYIRVNEKQAYDFHTSMVDQLRITSVTQPHLRRAKEIHERKRAEVIYTSDTKIAVAKNIQERISQRVLVFTARTKVADVLSPYSYHSKNKTEKNLQRFIDEEINTLCVVQMSDMGITFPDLKREVVHQLQSNSETSLQKFLRTCNLEDDREASIIVTVYKDTVDEGWARQAMEGVPSDKVTWMEMEEVDKLIEKLR